MAESVGRECEMDGCDKPHRARGLCATHYNRQHQPERHRKVVVHCAGCGVPCEKEPAAKFRERFCSYECRERHLATTGVAAERQRALQPYRDALAAQAAEVRTERAAALAASLAGRTCAACGATFDAKTTTQVVCSRRCRNRRKMLQDKDRTRLPVFERDGWRCHMCRRLTRRDLAVPHPLAPTIDHLVPRSAGGTDDPANLACACFECNCRRGSGGTVQLRLIG